MPSEVMTVESTSKQTARALFQTDETCRGTPDFEDMRRIEAKNIKAAEKTAQGGVGEGLNERACQQKVPPLPPNDPHAANIRLVRPHYAIASEASIAQQTNCKMVLLLAISTAGCACLA